MGLGYLLGRGKLVAHHASQWMVAAEGSLRLVEHCLEEFHGVLESACRLIGERESVDRTPGEGVVGAELLRVDVRLVQGNGFRESACGSKCVGKRVASAPEPRMAGKSAVVLREIRLEQVDRGVEVTG